MHIIASAIASSANSIADACCKPNMVSPSNAAAQSQSVDLGFGFPHAQSDFLARCMIVRVFYIDEPSPDGSSPRCKPLMQLSDPGDHGASLAAALPLSLMPSTAFCVTDSCRITMSR